MPRRYHLFQATLMIALLTAAGAAGAADEPRWYRVELLIFSNEPGTADERWDPSPTLAYPEKYRFLVHPDEIGPLRAEHNGPSELDARGQLFLNLPPEEPDTPDIPELGAEPTATAVEEDPNDARPAPDAGELEPSTPPRPTPFVALPPAQREFRGKAAYMERSGEYHILFHETWAQPMREEQDAIPLIIDRSGDTRQWPRLQGSVKLYIARYLHVETNLWLNTTGDYLPEHWRMPPPPLGPASIFVQEPVAEKLQGNWPVDADFTVADEETAAPAQEGAAEEAPAPVYPWRHAVLLQQSRRMRSLEVHYIDHPLFGVVIEFTPLDDEQLQALAEQEAGYREALEPSLPVSGNPSADSESF